MFLFVLSVATALSISFLCSLMEAALLSLTPSQVADLSARHPALGAIWRDFKANIERPIAVILILNTAAHTVGASVAGAQFDLLVGREWIWLFSLLFTFAMLQYTEILPKTLGVYFNRTIAQWIARPLAFAVRAFTPLIRVLHFLNRPFEGPRTAPRISATLEEIAALAAMARMAEHIGARQERIIKGAGKLSELKAQQLMIPIEQASVLSKSQSIAEAIIAAHIDAHTRFPVCEDGEKTKIIGYVNFKEMIYFMSSNPNDPTLRGVIRPIISVPPDGLASELLEIFIGQHEHIAVVRDADGPGLGIITLEDLIEELVGDLEDEFDRLPRHAHALSGGTWMFGGGLPMSEVKARLGAEIEAPSGTLAGWIAQTLDRSPKPGDNLRFAGIELTVRRVRRGRAFEILAVPKPAR